MNNVVLVGRLTRDVESRTTSAGTIIATFTLAVSKGDGDADFINCTSFGKQADVMSRYTHKGSSVAIRGRLQTRNYEDNNGNKRIITEVIVENIFLISSGKTTSKSLENEYPETTSIKQEEIIVTEDDLPF